MDRDYDTPVWQLTVRELLALIDKKQEITIKEESKKEYVYGLAGLAKTLGCSKNYAWKLKNTGMFDDAIIQNGRKIIIDSEKVLELFDNYKNR